MPILINDVTEIADFCNFYSCGILMFHNIDKEKERIDVMMMYNYSGNLFTFS
jgi:hypothetical protein